METEVVREVEPQDAGHVEHERTEVLKGHREVLGEMGEDLEVEHCRIEPCQHWRRDHQQKHKYHHINKYQSHKKKQAVVIT